MSLLPVSGHFIEGAKGPIFVLLRRPNSAARGCLLVVPPFAEEMNKSRRMVTDLALRLADRGMATLIPDLYGTGDSGGDFGDSDWTTWLGDLAAVSQWSDAQGCPVTAILAIRLGGALAVSGTAIGAVPPVHRTVFWQPVFDGGRLLSQFLRLRIAASLMEDRKETLAELRTRLQGGDAVEVAGYSLSAQLAADLQSVTPPECLADSLGDISWIEVVRDPGASLPVPSVELIEKSRRHGTSIQVRGVAGEPYWSSTEIVVNRDVVEASVDFLFAGMQRAEVCADG